MLRPIAFETDELEVHSFRITDIVNFKQLAEDILSIFSDTFTLKFVPDKKMHTMEEAEGFVKAMILNHHVGRNHLHFITSKKMSRVVGIVDLISPEVAKEYYQLEDYPYFIEFYLLEILSGQSIMTQLLPVIVGHLHNEGIKKIGAVVNRKNKAAIKVLERSGFKVNGQFDILQDLYLSFRS